MKHCFHLIFIAVFTVSCTSVTDFDPVKYVDPQIGSVHGSMGSWLPCGYDNRHGSIEGFGHFHEFQVGIDPIYEFEISIIILPDQKYSRKYIR